MSLMALLTSGPMTGYDLTKQFSASVGYLWHAPDSQIYPELRKMHAEGLLSAEQVPWGKKGATKTEYSLTETGAQAFRDWEDTPLPYVSDRDVHRLKAAYFEWAETASAHAQLQAHIAHYEGQRLQAQARIRELSTRQQRTLERRLQRFPEHEHERIIAFKVFAYEGQIARADQEIAWARRGIKLLRRLDADETPPSD